MTVCPAKTKISLGIRLVWSGSLLSAWRKLESLATHWAHTEDWSDWADAQADLSLRWVHTHFVGFVVLWLIWRISYCTILRSLFSWDCSEQLLGLGRLVWVLPGCKPPVMFFVPWLISKIHLSQLAHSSNVHAQPSSGVDVWFLVGPFICFNTSCVRTAKALARLCGCAGSPEHLLVAYVISTIISWAGSFVHFSQHCSSSYIHSEIIFLTFLSKNFDSISNSFSRFFHQEIRKFEIWAKSSYNILAWT